MVEGWLLLDIGRFAVTASYFVKIIRCSRWFCTPLFLGRVLFYLRSPKGGCCSISDDLSCSFVLVNSNLFHLPCEAGSTIPREGFNLKCYYSCIIARLSDVRLPSLFLRHCNFSRFRMHILNIPTCVHLQVGGHYLVFLALNFRYSVLL